MQWLWPSIDNIEEASVQSRTGSAVAIIISLATAVITYLQANGTINWFEHVDQTAYIDAVIFFIIGLCLRFHSRIAALAGLLLYGFEQYVMIKAYGFRFNLLSLFFIIAFMNAVRGAFAYHQFKRQMKNEEAPSSSQPERVSALTGLPIPNSREISPPETESPKKKLPWLRIIMTLLTLLVIGLAVVTFSDTKSREKIRSLLPGGSTGTGEDFDPAGTGTESADPSVQIFKLKSGKIVTGRVVVDDPVYITVQVSSKKQEVILREDLVKE